MAWDCYQFGLQSTDKTNPHFIMALIMLMLYIYYLSNLYDYDYAAETVNVTQLSVHGNQETLTCKANWHLDH